MSEIKLSFSMKEVIGALRAGKFLVISKKITEAFLVFDDFSYYKEINHWVADELKSRELIKKVDSRSVSNVYSLTELGKIISI